MLRVCPPAASPRPNGAPASMPGAASRSLAACLVRRHTAGPFACSSPVGSRVLRRSASRRSACTSTSAGCAGTAVSLRTRHNGRAASCAGTFASHRTPCIGSCGAGACRSQRCRSSCTARDSCHAGIACARSLRWWLSASWLQCCAVVLLYRNRSPAAEAATDLHPEVATKHATKEAAGHNEMSCNIS